MVLEGILCKRIYGGMLVTLAGAHRGRTFFYYLDVSLEETLRRHTTRPQATQFSANDMRGWYTPRDVLGVDGEQVIPETASMEETIALTAADAGWALHAPVGAR